MSVGGGGGVVVEVECGSDNVNRREEVHNHTKYLTPGTVFTKPP